MELESGSILALQVGGGREVLCRVVARHGAEACVVAMCWEGPAGTASSVTMLQRTARTPLPTSHHAWRRPLTAMWLSPGPLPAEVRVAGKAPLDAALAGAVVHPQEYVAAADKAALESRVVPAGSWTTFLQDVRLQWRWDHDRDALLREEAAQKERQQAVLQAALASAGERKERLRAGGVKGLRKRRFFAAWKGEVPRALQQAAERLMREALADLDGATKAAAAKRLLQLVKAFNALDGAHGRDFDAADAEDIMEAVGQVAEVFGLDEAARERLERARRF